MRTVLEEDCTVPAGGFERLPFPTPNHAMTLPHRDMYRVRVSARFVDLSPGEILQLRVLQNGQVVLQLIEFPLEETETLAGERVLDLRADDEIAVEALHGGTGDYTVSAKNPDEISELGDGTILDVEKIE